MATTWLVTGGAGYIGAHVVRELLAAGIKPVVIDDLSSGHREFVPDGVEFITGSILDTDLLADALLAHRCVGVMHIAGYKYAGVSVSRPLHTYEQNAQGTASVLSAMQRENVRNLVFSSSAAVYGTPVGEVTETSATLPESPYGESKLIGEWLIRDVARADAVRAEHAEPGSPQPWRATCLRYFNVVGSGTPEVYDSSPHNLFPLVIEALLAGKTPRINGVDYDTPDGTCVRDYVHVADLARSHAAAAAAMMAGHDLAPVYNLGSGQGLSVRQIMDAMRRVTGVDFSPEIGPRRPGDPARIVARGDLAARDLDWQMRWSIDDMAKSAWDARRAADSSGSAR